MYYNIEKSGFRRGEYVGYANGAWKIERVGKNWRARKQTVPTMGVSALIASTLREMSAKLETISKGI